VSQTRSKTVTDGFEDVTLPLEVSAKLMLSKRRRTGRLIFPRVPFSTRWSMPPNAVCATAPDACSASLAAA
jgi:hypothetical protein